MIGFWNMAFTAAPPFILGVTDKYVDARFLMANPQLYSFGPRNKFCNQRTFWQSVSNACIHSLLLFSLIYVLFGVSDPVTLQHGHVAGHWWLGCLSYLCVLCTVTLKVGLIANFWTLLLGASLVISIGLWFAYLALYTPFTEAFFPATHFELAGMLRELMTSPVFWLTFPLVSIIVCTRDLAWKFYKRQYRPREYHIVQEIEMEEQRLGKEIRLQPRISRQVTRIGKDDDDTQGSNVLRGFSFSQDEPVPNVLI
jgi:phospholipid-transporting ATPase